MILERIGKKEKEYVRQVLASQFRSSAGSEMTGRLEAAFAARFGVDYAVSFINGTATLHAALAAAGVQPGDEVIVPPLTMASTAFAVLHADAIPVFADVDPGTWTLSPESIKREITAKTRAIIPVSLYGLAPDMPAIMEIAARHNLFVLEDAAQCFLGFCHGRVVGSIGHAASFSFQSSKHLASGEGGMIITANRELALRIRRFNSLGYKAVGGAAAHGKICKEMIQEPGYERHASVGWNYRMPELCAAVALAQLERIDDFVEMRRSVAGLFAEAIKDCSWLTPQRVTADYQHAYWSYALRLGEDVPFSWQEFRDKYSELGGDGIYGAWQLTYLEPALRGLRLHPDQSQQFSQGLCPVAEALQPRLLQFKTNYFDLDLAGRKADALQATISFFGA